jgi:uncharacterized protein (DUF849 family)
VNLQPFITCAVTGAGDSAGVHPELPITPAQIAAASLEAARAGAAVVHIHVRDPETGAAARRPELYREVVERIREADEDVLINLTTGMGGDLYVGEQGAQDTPAPGSDIAGPVERVAHVDELRPDLCTLDVGSLNFGPTVYLAPFDWVARCAQLIREYGVKPEMEVFDLGHIRIAEQLIADDLVEPPPFMQVCLGIPWGAPADTRTMQAMVAALPANAVWSGFGIGRMQMPMVAQAVLLGGNVRVGLEDNLYLERGVFASNAQLVERAIGIVERMGASVVGPDAVRERLRLRNRDGVPAPS